MNPYQHQPHHLTQNLTNYILTKQNCLSLSNQTDSLLVSSSIRASTHGQISNIKKQKRLNSQRLDNKDRKRFLSNLKEYDTGKQQEWFGNNVNQQKNKNNKQSQITIADCVAQLQYHHKDSNKTNYHHLIDNHPKFQSNCPKCTQQLPLISQKLSKTTHRLEQLQTLIKLCFSKTMFIQNFITKNTNQLIQVKMRVQQSQKVIKKHQQVLVKSSVGKGMELQDVKIIVERLGQKIDSKTKQMNQVIELQKGIIHQKIQRLTIKNEQRFQTLIQMVEQLARLNKTQSLSSAKTVINNKQTTKTIKHQHQQLQKTKTKSIPSLSHINNNQYQQHNLSSLNSFITNSNKQNRQQLYHTHRRQQNKRSQSKSKISYYLSKSNFNDATTLCDTMVNPLENGGV